MTDVQLAPSLDRHLRNTPFTGLMGHQEAHEAWCATRSRLGLSTSTAPSALPLLTGIGDNLKMDKKAKFLLRDHGINGQVGISLAPASMSGDWQVCTSRTAGCEEGCLASSGNALQYEAIPRARIARTKFLGDNPTAFISLVTHELQGWVRRRGGIGFRPNILSDLRWERYAPGWFSMAGVTAHDYTKHWNREPSHNYHLTYSANERRGEDEIRQRTEDGHNVAVVFAIRRDDPMPTEWRGIPVVNGDEHDFRPIDPKGVIVGLRPKGVLRIDSPFVFPSN